MDWQENKATLEDLYKKAHGLVLDAAVCFLDYPPKTQSLEDSIRNALLDAYTMGLRAREKDIMESLSSNSPPDN